VPWRFSDAGTSKPPDHSMQASEKPAHVQNMLDQDAPQ
jgi:hypothetical protein